MAGVIHNRLSSRTSNATQRLWSLIELNRSTCGDKFSAQKWFSRNKNKQLFVPSSFCSEKKIEKFLARNMFRVIFYFTNSFKSHIFISGIFFEFWNQNFFLKFLSSAKTPEKRKKMLKTFFLKRFLGEKFSMFASKVQCAIMTICSLFFFFKPVCRRNSDENCCQRWDLNHGA